MKLATFETDGRPQLGIVQNDRIVPLGVVASGLPDEMVGLIAAWPQVKDEVRRIALAGAEALPRGSARRSAGRARSWPSV